MDTRYLNKFYKKSRSAKLEALKEAAAISFTDYEQLKEQTLKLPSTVADQMIENYITNYELPLGSR